MNKNQSGKSTGAIVGAVVIIALLVIGGILLSRQDSAMNEAQPVESIEDLSTTEDATNQEAETEAAMTDSVDPAVIEAELEAATDFSDLDAELEALEAELGAETE